MLLPSIELVPLLSIILTLLTIHADTSDLDKIALNPAPIVKALEEDHDVEPDLSSGIMVLFGELGGGEWKVDTKRIVGEIGKGLLAGLRSEGREVDMFMAEWEEKVGEWASIVDLKLLEVSTPLHLCLVHSSF